MITAKLKTEYLLLTAIPLLVAGDSISTNHRGFADALTANLYGKENECSSALGVSMAFSLIYPGSTGNSTDQIRDVMGYPNGTQLRLVWKNVSSRLGSVYEGQCQMFFGGECHEQAPTLKIANSVWLDDNGTVTLTYETVVGTSLHQIDFEADDSSVIVNKWVENQTNGLIDSIVPDDEPLYPPYILIAINSIYLQASWTNPFNEQNTNEDSFYSMPNRQTEVTKAHFMHQVYERLRYSHEALPCYQVAELPFAVSTLSMIVTLPVCDSVVPTASSEQVLTAIGELETTRVALSLPKFKFESKYEDALKDALQTIGVVAPFSGDLCGLFGSCGPFIDKIIQKTVIDVNEKGVEAAAVTAVSAIKTAGLLLEDPVLMELNHPFQFFIYDQMEDVVLFEGRVGAPDVPEGSVASLRSVHSEDDFWSKNFDVNPNSVVLAEGTSEPMPSVASSCCGKRRPDNNVVPSPIDKESEHNSSRRNSFPAIVVFLFVFVFGFMGG